MRKTEEIVMDLELRVATLELKMNQLTSAAKGNSAKSLALEEPVQKSSQSAYVPPTPSQPIRNEYAPKESRFHSSSLLGIIGIAFVILAGLFFVKISVDSGWLTPLRQLLLASVTGLAFFFAPQFFPKAEKEYGALLAGAGTTILHLTWLGAFFYHKVLSVHLALGFATLIGVFSILANFENGNRLYLLVAMAGTYLAAPLIGYNTGDLSVITLFLIVWNVSFSATAFFKERRDILFIASYYAVFSVLLLSGKYSSPENLAYLLEVQLIQFGLFATGLLLFSVVYKNPMSSEEGGALLPVLLLFYLSTSHILSSLYPDYSQWFGISIGVVTLGIYFLARALLTSDVKSGPSLTSFATLTILHSFYFQILEERIKPLASLVIGSAAILIWSQSTRARDLYRWPLIILFAVFAYGSILAIFGLGVSSSISVWYNFSFGGLLLFAIFGFMQANNSRTSTWSPLSLILCYGHFQVMLGLYRMSEKISWSSSLFLTFAWGLYASLILLLAFYRRDKALGNSALIVLLAVSLKALFYDLSNTGNLIRVMSLFVEGIVLYGCGWIFKKMQFWQDQ